jgi:transcriptional antiterminator NusG
MADPVKEKASAVLEAPGTNVQGAAGSVPPTEEEQWYSLHVLSGQEAKVKKSIEQRAKIEEMGDLIGQVVIPVERVSEIRRGKKAEAERKLFPGYVFVQMKLRDQNQKIIEKTWYFIRETPGVIGFADGEHPLPMSRDQVEALLRQVREGEEKVIPKVAFAVGDRVRVGDGPFLNSEGVIEEIDPEKGKLRVSVSIFGRSTPVELEYWQVEKIS